MGGEDGAGILVYERVLELDENGELQVVSQVKNTYLIREFKIGKENVWELPSRGPGTYLVDIIKITSEDYIKALETSEVKIPIEYDPQLKRTLMKFGGSYLLGGNFEYNDKLRVADEIRGGLRAVLVLNPNEGNAPKRAIAAYIFADPETGELKARYAFTYDVNDPAHSWKSVFDYKVKDNQICIGHTTGKSIRHSI
jgi:hypothetical protein